MFLFFILCSFFFQAEDGIRDGHVTGVQTCALPILRRTSTLISQKLEVEQEISVMVSQKKFESNAISMAPIIIVAVLSYSASDYMIPLYRWSDFGPIVMTICLLIIGFSFWISQKIMDIKV